MKLSVSGETRRPKAEVNLNFNEERGILWWADVC